MAAATSVLHALLLLLPMLLLLPVLLLLTLLQQMQQVLWWQVWQVAQRQHLVLGHPTADVILQGTCRDECGHGAPARMRHQLAAEGGDAAAQNESLINMPVIKSLALAGQHSDCFAASDHWNSAIAPVATQTRTHDLP